MASNKLIKEIQTELKSTQTQLLAMHQNYTKVLNENFELTRQNMDYKDQVAALNEELAMYKG